MIFSPYANYTEEQLKNRERYNNLRNEKYELERELDVEVTHYNVLEKRRSKMKTEVIVWGSCFTLTALVLIIMLGLQNYNVIQIREDEGIMSFFGISMAINLLAAVMFYYGLFHYFLQMSEREWIVKLTEKLEFEQLRVIKEASAKKVRMLTNQIDDIKLEMSQITDR